jgi:hypothetical protein
MTLGRFYPYVSMIGSGLLVLGSFLPLWEKNGVSVNAWEGDYLSVGRWILVVVALAAVVMVAVPALRKPTWLGMAGLLGLIQAGLIFWRGYKLHAIGWGIWFLLAGAILILASAVLLRLLARQDGN